MKTLAITTEERSGSHTLRYNARGDRRPRETFTDEKDLRTRISELKKDFRSTGRLPFGKINITYLIQILDESYFPLKSRSYAEQMRVALIRLGQINNSIDYIKQFDITEHMGVMISNGYSRSTTNNWKNLCKAALTFAKANNIISENPFENVKSVHVDRRKIRIVTDDELNLLLHHCYTRKDTLIIVMARYGGMRACEVAAFDIKIDIMPNDTLCVRTAKTGKVRYVQMPVEFMEMLKRYATVVLRKYHPRPFYNGNGNRISSRYQRLKKRTGAQFRYHDLRETCATDLARKGMNPWLLKEYMGHEDIRMTQQYYIGKLEDGKSIWD